MTNNNDLLLDLYRTCQDHAVDDRQEGLLRGMITAYHEQWVGVSSAWRLVATEGVLSSDLTNLETGRASRSFGLAGKIDKIIEVDGRLVVVDHKTTSQNIVDPAAPYWRQLQVDNQGQFYWCLALSNGLQVDRVVWDVAFKSSSRPRKLTKADLSEIEKRGTYFSRQCSDDAISHAVSQGNENPELFGWRIAHNHSTKSYFQRGTLPRSQQELVDFNAQTWDIAQDMLATRRSRRHHKNPSACMLYNSPCEYLGVCSGYDTIDSHNWVALENVHVELGDAAPDVDVITTSRATCFLTCRRKHFYRYEIGKRKVKEERKEAFQFGTTWHHLMDEWWTSVLKEA